MKKKPSEIVASVILHVIMLLLGLVTLYPFWHVIMYSISDPIKAMGGGIFLWPKGFSTIGFDILFKTNQVYVAYGNSLFLLCIHKSGDELKQLKEEEDCGRDNYAEHKTEL